MGSNQYGCSAKQNHAYRVPREVSGTPNVGRTGKRFDEPR